MTVLDFYEKSFCLPTVDFVGGEREVLQFRCFLRNTKQPFDLTGCRARFAVTEHLSRQDPPILAKDMMLTKNKDGVSHILTVVLESVDTKELAGKYIYQISICDEGEISEIPKQGVFLIQSNIDKGFLHSKEGGNV